MVLSKRRKKKEDLFQEKYAEAIKGLPSHRTLSADTLNKINLVSNEINFVTNEKISHKKGYLIRGDLKINPC